MLGNDVTYSPTCPSSILKSHCVSLWHSVWHREDIQEVQVDRPRELVDAHASSVVCVTVAKESWGLGL